MFLDRTVGSLTDPLDGRNWGASEVLSLVRSRVERYAELGLKRSDRVFLHHGNTLEFFVDLLAIWELGGCVVPVDGRLTPFEVEVLAQAAKPRFSVWKGETDPNLAATLAAIDVRISLAVGPEGSPEEASSRTQLSRVLDGRRCSCPVHVGNHRTTKRSCAHPPFASGPMDESARKTWSGLISPHPVSAAYPFWTWTDLQLSVPLAFG